MLDFTYTFAGVPVKNVKYVQGLRVIEEAEKLDSEHFDVLKMFSVCLGAAVKYQSFRDQIRMYWPELHTSCFRVDLGFHCLYL